MTVLEKTFSIVIPSFNGETLLVKNLPRLVKIFPKNEIIVVDDGSRDNTQNFLKQNFPHIRVLINKNNKGFSTTANRGIFNAKSPLVFLLNNDCYPEANFMSLVPPYFQDPQTFAVGCLEKSKNKERGRGIGGINRGLFYHQPGALNKNNTLWTFGAGTVYNKEIFKQLGGFDEDFNPFYWEDFDLSYRALKSGFKLFFEPRAVIVHEHSTTIKKYYSSQTVERISFRNQLMTYWKNITDNNLIFNHICWLPYHLIFTSIRTGGTFFFGFIMALGNLFKILNKRKNNQFVYSDEEVLRPFQKELSSLR
jgi:GT2 family glycosyltransferase